MAKTDEYVKGIHEMLNNIIETNKDSFKEVIDEVYRTIKEDKIIHVFGTGHSHMTGIEMFSRAGGLGNVDAMLDPDSVTVSGAIRGAYVERIEGLSEVIWKNYHFEEGDIIIIVSNSGRNAVPVEMAMIAREHGVKVIALTNIAQSKRQSSRHHSGKHLYELADIVIDTLVPFGDSMVDIDGIKTGAASNISAMFIVDYIVVGAIEKAIANGIRPHVFQSQNLDGFSNDAIYEYYRGRVKHY